LQSLLSFPFTPLPRSAEERRRRQEQPNGVPENLMLQMRPW